MGVFGKCVPQGPGGQRHTDFDARTLSNGGGDLARTANLLGTLLHIFQAPMTGLSISLLEIESASVVGNGERQPTRVVVDCDADLIRLSMPIGVVCRFLSDAQQFFF